MTFLDFSATVFTVILLIAYFLVLAVMIVFLFKWILMPILRFVLPFIYLALAGLKGLIHGNNDRTASRSGSRRHSANRSQFRDSDDLEGLR